MDSSASAPVDVRSTADIYQEAAGVNDQVTDRLKNALQIVNDTRDVQADTLADLKKQGRQLADVQDTIEDVQEDTKYASAVLDDIGCLCWCFGRKKSKNMQRPVHREKYRPDTTAATTRPNGTQTMVRNEIELQGPSNSKEGTNAPEGDPVLRRIEEGKREQDALTDRIAQGLDVLKQGARDMGTELARQQDLIDGAETKVEDATQKAAETAHHPAFRRHLRNY